MFSAALLGTLAVRFSDASVALEPACNSGDGVHTSASSPATWAFPAKNYFYAQVNNNGGDPVYLRIRLGDNVDMGAIRVQHNDKNGNSNVEALSYAYSTGIGYNDLIMQMNGFASHNGLNCKSDVRIFSTEAWKVWGVSASSSLSELNQCSYSGVLAPQCNSTEQQCLSPCIGQMPTPRSIRFPARGVFYYPWFPQTWTVGGHYTHWHPTLGYYSSSSSAVIDKHIEAFEYGKIEVAIASWWGINEKHEQLILPMLLDRAAERNSDTKFAVFYEKEGFSDKDSSLPTLRTDMAYLEERYAGHPHYAHVEGKPVMFVWNVNSPSCNTVNKFNEASNGKWFVVMKVFRGYKDCIHNGGNWMQYGVSDSGEVEASPHSFTIGPGFFKADETTARVERDIGRFKNNVKHMVASGHSWQLIVSFDEFGEGTGIESSKEWASSSGFGDYLDALHNDGAAPTPIPTPTPRPTPTPSTPPPPSPAPAPVPAGQDTIVSGGRLAPGDALVSAGGHARLSMQSSDGNLVLRGCSSVVWASGTIRHPGAELRLQQSDGNLVLYDGSTPLWSSGSSPGAVSAKLQDDCNLVTMDSSDKVLWSLGTSCSSSVVTV